ncbi:MAG: hypothetical protein EBY17_22630 [Acidobacteriia bacterium]|jgi:hypothetical protein|nr:hypothetical protein [Terriglobia bacterium]
MKDTNRKKKAELLYRMTHDIMSLQDAIREYALLEPSFRAVLPLLERIDHQVDVESQILGDVEELI